MTTDFFAPLVDDPYAYGAIAAANAMSDVYAMGGEVVLALNIAAFPEDLPPDVVADILRGGADKVTEAGGIVAGGHTIIDAEPKFGLCVLGLVHPELVLMKGGARPGDALFLTKPLGTGIVTTAAKRRRSCAGTPRGRDREHDAAQPARLAPGARGGGAGADGHHRLQPARARLRDGGGERGGVPVRGIARAAAAGRARLRRARHRDRRRGAQPGSISRGRCASAVGIAEAMEHVLFDPQTSGGLLFAVGPERAVEMDGLFAVAGERVWRVGDVVEGSGVEVGA